MKDTSILMRFAIFVLVVWVQKGNTQSQNVDSLFRIWSDSTKSPVERVDAFYHRFTPLDRIKEATNPEGMRWGSGIKEAQKLARQTGKEEYLPKFLILEAGGYFFFQNEREKGCTLALEAFNMAMDQGDFENAFLL